MPRSYSLQRKKDFDALFKKGVRRYSKFFTAVFAPSEHMKFGLIVQKKNVVKASHRNYCRRVMREILRKDFLTATSKNFTLALIVKTDLKIVVKEKGFDTVRKDLLQLLSQMK